MYPICHLLSTLSITSLSHPTFECFCGSENCSVTCSFFPLSPAQLQNMMLLCLCQRHIFQEKNFCFGCVITRASNHLDETSPPDYPENRRNFFLQNPKNSSIRSIWTDERRCIWSVVVELLNIEQAREKGAGAHLPSRKAAVFPDRE